MYIHYYVGSQANSKQLLMHNDIIRKVVGWCYINKRYKRFSLCRELYFLKICKKFSPLPQLLYMHKAIVWTNNKIDAECKNLATEYDKTQQVYISLLKKKIARIEKSPWQGWNALSTSKKRNFHLDNKMLKIGRHERLWCHSKMFLTYTLHGGLPLFFLLQCDDIFL